MPPGRTHGRRCRRAWLATLCAAQRTRGSTSTRRRWSPASCEETGLVASRLTGRHARHHIKQVQPAVHLRDGNCEGTGECGPRLAAVRTITCPMTVCTGSTGRSPSSPIDHTRPVPSRTTYGPCRASTGATSSTGRTVDGWSGTTGLPPGSVPRSGPSPPQVMKARPAPWKGARPRADIEPYAQGR